MKLTSLSRTKTPVHLTEDGFKALADEAHQLATGPATTQRYRLACTEDKKGVCIVPAQSTSLSPRSMAHALGYRKPGGRAQRSLQDFLQRLCHHPQADAFETARAQQALAAVLALPDEFDHQALHQAIRSVSIAESRARIGETAGQVLNCVEALSQAPHAFASVQRPLSASCSDAKRVQQALSDWRAAFELEWQLLTQRPAAASEKDDLAGLWTRLFTRQFAQQAATATLSPARLCQQTLSEAEAEIERAHEALQAVVKGKGEHGCEAWVRASEDLITAVGQYLQRLALVAQGLFEMSTLQAESDPELKPCALPHRHRDLWQNLARTLLDQACASLHPHSACMLRLDEALACRSQALLARDTAAAEASAALLQARVAALPRLQAGPVAGTSEQQGADAAYGAAIDAVEQAEKRLNLCHQAASDLATPGERLSALDARLQAAAQNPELELQTLWSVLVDRPIAQLNGLMFAIHGALQSAGTAEASEDPQRLQALSQRLCTELPRALGGLAAVAGVLASEARDITLPNAQRERLLALSESLLDLARAVLDPAGRHMGYFHDAANRLASTAQLPH